MIKLKKAQISLQQTKLGVFTPTQIKWTLQDDIIEFDVALGKCITVPITLLIPECQNLFGAYMWKQNGLAWTQDFSEEMNDYLQY